MKPSADSHILQAATDLLAIQSTAENPAELRAAYDFMAGYVRKHAPAEVTIEEFESNGKPSFLAYRGTKRPKKFHIILNAHVDVVPGTPEQFEPVIKRGKLYARGAYDMKAAAVILAQVFCEYVANAPYALGLQIVTDEEQGTTDGTQYQIEQGVRAEFIICGDAGRHSSAFEIANEAKGVAMVEAGFTGASAHGAYPWRGDNAALQATRFIDTLHRRFPVPAEETPETTVTVTAINADGGSHTRTPGKSSIKLDVRFAPGDKRFAGKRQLTAFLRSVDPNAKLIAIHSLAAPIYCDPNGPLAQALKAAAETTEGHEFHFARRNGTCDGRFYSAVGGQACEFGLAGEHQHADGEYVTLKAFGDYLATMRRFLQQAG